MSVTQWLSSPVCGSVTNESEADSRRWLKFFNVLKELGVLGLALKPIMRYVAGTY
jgi:hypothetical protein